MDTISRLIKAKWSPPKSDTAKQAVVLFQYDKAATTFERVLPLLNSKTY